jgi:hypothetical protein
MMTPAKKEAKELIGLFELATGSKIRGKGCALICVNKILETYTELDPKLKHWQKVKQEIINYGTKNI